jgi:hypothetical protein
MKTGKTPRRMKLDVSSTQRLLDIAAQADASEAVRFGRCLPLHLAIL